MKTIRIIITIAMLMAFAATALADTDTDVSEYAENDVSALATTVLDSAKPVYNGNNLDVLIALAGAEYAPDSGLNANPQVGVILMVKHSSYLFKLDLASKLEEYYQAHITKANQDLLDLSLAYYTPINVLPDNMTLPAIYADVLHSPEGSLSIMSILTDDVNALQGLQFIIDDGTTTSRYNIPFELFKQYTGGSERGADMIEGDLSAAGGATFTFLGVNAGGELVLTGEGGDAISFGLAISEGGAAAASNQFIYGQDARLIGQTIKTENGATLVSGNPQTATFATNGLIALNGEGMVDAALYSGDTNNPNTSALAFAVEQSGDSGALQISNVSLTQLSGASFDPSQSVYYKSPVIIGGMAGAVMKCPNCEVDVTINLTGVASVEQLENAVHKAICGVAGHRVCDELSHDNDANCVIGTSARKDDFFDPERSSYFKRFIRSKGRTDVVMECPHCYSDVQIDLTGITTNKQLEDAIHASDCGVAGHLICDEAKHERPNCGFAGHCVSDNIKHIKLRCMAHYVCVVPEHEHNQHKKYACRAHNECEDANADRHTLIMSCGDHYACAGGEGHDTKHACGDHYACAGGDHGKLSCGAHFKCFVAQLDWNKHAAHACGAHGYLCGGEDASGHAPLTCGVHFACESGDHSALPCGHCACESGDHAALPCGHYACESGDHAAMPCGHYACESGDHAALPCRHYGCAGGNHSALPCGHYACESGDHSELSCGHFACESGDHTALPCGHYVCGSGDHAAMPCGHYECESGNHGFLPCGHYGCAGGDHAALPCGHYACESGDHAALPCGHFACESGDHTALPCGHYGCAGGDHAALPCGHYECESGNHGFLPCGHYGCAGGDHAAQPCGHYACESGNHSAQPCGHYACASGDHAALPCGHFRCIDGDHKKLPCGHYECESGNHGSLLCGHYECQDGNHELLPCGTHHKCQISQSEWTGHAAHACGKHYLCMERDASRHAPLYCNRHYACDPEATSAIHSISCRP